MVHDSDTWWEPASDGGVLDTFRDPTESHPLPEPTVLSELTLGQELGRGGMGVVHLARQARLDRQVAVKSLLDPTNDTALVGLMREARLTARLEHPNIVPVHALLVDAAGSPQLVLKRIQGVPWTTLIADPRALPEGQRDDPLAFHVEVLIQVCRAIEFAHANDVVHRDLKPDNIMVGPFGEVYVLDWGVACPVERRGEGDALVPRQRFLVGTPAFMAPEMMHRDGSVGFAADVWLLGGLLYAVLAGRPPRDHGSLQATLEAWNHEPPVDPAWPQELQHLVRACLQLDQGARPSVTAVREGLTRSLRSRETAALRAGLAQQVEALKAQLDGGDDAATYRQLGACQFALQTVLGHFPHDPDAHRLQREVLHTMARFELGAGRPHAAQAMLAQDDTPPPELRATVDAAVAALGADQQRLGALERDLDDRTARGHRMLVVALTGMVFLGIPLAMLGLGFERGPTRTLVRSALTLTAFVAIGLVFAGPLRRSRVNRGILALMILSPFWGLVTGIAAQLLATDITTLTVFRTLFDALLLSAGGVLFDRRLLPGAALYASAGLACAVWPAHTDLLLLSATVAVMTNVLVLWSVAPLMERVAGSGR